MAEYELYGQTINTRLFSIDIKDIQKAMAENQAMINKLASGGAFGRALPYATQAAHRYAVSITHVDTGALKGSHRMQLLSRFRGLIYLDPAAVGPHGPPAHYGPYEHNRGGSHAFYDRVIAEVGNRIAEQAEKITAKELGF